MSQKFPGFYVTGTDTGVGKTYVAALLARTLVGSGYRVGVYKPAASGCCMTNGKLVSEDAVQLWEAAGRPGTLDEVCPQRFEAPLAPHLAARYAGSELDVNLLRTGVDLWTNRSDITIVEGAGGLLSPLGEEDYNADLALELRFPLLVVSPNQLGVINQTLLTLVAAATFRDGLEVAGIVLNDATDCSHDESRTSNRNELELRCVAPILAHVNWRATSINAKVDWFRLAQ